MVKSFVTCVAVLLLNYLRNLSTTLLKEFASSVLPLSHNNKKQSKNQLVFNNFAFYKLLILDLTEDDLLTAQFYLRSITYDYEKPFLDTGSRDEKRYFQVKQGTEELVMTLVCCVSTY